MRSSTSSFLFAKNRFGWIVPWANSQMLFGFTFKDIWRVDLVEIALFRYGNLLRDLDKVDAGGEVRDAARHDSEELVATQV
jgi:hypothetical protein